MQINSRSNEKFKIWKSLTSSRGIKSENAFLFSGKKQVQEFMRAPSTEILAELIPSGGSSVGTDPKIAFELSAELFREVDELGTGFNLLVLKTPHVPPWEKGSFGLHILCPLGDPSNVGALLRSAEAFGADSVVLLEEAASPFLPKAVKASSGSCLKVPMSRGPSVHNLANIQGLVALDKQGRKLKDYIWPKCSFLLIGEEGQGVPSLLSAQAELISIPTAGVESLNATIAASIAMYDYATKKRL